MTIDEFLRKLEGVKAVGENRWMALCPAHEDRRPSLSIARGEKGIVLKCHAGCKTSDILAKLGLKPIDLFDAKFGLKSADMFANADRSTGTATRATPTGQLVYAYRDEQGRLLFEVVRGRGPGKTFHQRQPDPSKPGRWILNLKGVRRVPYRLPELLAAAADQPVFVVEGEKDVDNVRELGLVATTNPCGVGGGGLWADPKFAAPLAGRPVIVLPDNDPPGRQHAERVAESLVAAGAKSVRVLELPGLRPEGGDVSDWIATGGNRAQLLELADGCPVFRPRRRDAGAHDAESDEKPEKVSEAQRILELAQREVELFRSVDDNRGAFASVRRNRGPLETWPVRSTPFRLYLTELVLRAERRVPRVNALAEAVNALEALATVEEKTRRVGLRTGQHQSRVFIDLAATSWRLVEITDNGWFVRDSEAAPIRFKRSGSMLALPEPVRGGNVDELRGFLNAGGEQNWRLLLAWLTYGFLSAGAFPILVLQGEQGSAKSTTARVLCRLIDPSDAELRVMPKLDSEVMIAAKNSLVLAYDNLSGMPHWLSDCLCRLSTGAAYTARTLYTNDEETVLRAKCPVIVNGIDDMTTRPDFADRAIMVSLPAIAADRRREEAEFWSAFGEAQARILGAVCSAVAGALRELPRVNLTSRPRMADFARWGVALERALGWPEGAFLAAYQGNLAESAATALDADPIASGLVEFMSSRASGEWDGTMGELLEVLAARVPDARKGRRWPYSPQSLTSRIRRVLPVLRREGIEAVPLDRSRAKRLWRLTRRELPESSSPSSSFVIDEGNRDVDAALAEPLADGRDEEAARRVTNCDEEALRHLEFVTDTSPSVRDDGDDPDDLPILSSLGEEEVEADGASGSGPHRGDEP
jgi:hypothetical protein